MDVILIFSDKDEEILENYSLMGDTVDKYQEKTINKYLGKDYKVQKDSIYVLNEIEQEKKEKLSDILTVPLMEMSTVKNEYTANQIKEQLIVNIPESQKSYIQNMSLIDIIKNMPEQQRDEALKQFSEQMNNMSESLREQAAIASVKEMYKELGVDTDKLQNNYIYCLESKC